MTAEKRSKRCAEKLAFARRAIELRRLAGHCKHARSQRQCTRHRRAYGRQEAGDRGWLGLAYALQPIASGYDPSSRHWSYPLMD